MKSVPGSMSANLSVYLFKMRSCHVLHILQEGSFSILSSSEQNFSHVGIYTKQSQLLYLFMHVMCTFKTNNYIIAYVIGIATVCCWSKKTWSNYGKHLFFSFRIHIFEDMLARVDVTWGGKNFFNTLCILFKIYCKKLLRNQISAVQKIWNLKQLWNWKLNKV